MKKCILLILLLMSVTLQKTWSQGFRVYNSDGTVLQFSLRTDSIVFYDGIGSEQDLGLFTPVNQMIVGTWYKSKSESVTFNEDGTTDLDEEELGASYEFFPFQGDVVIYPKTGGNRCSIFHVVKLTKDSIIMNGAGSFYYDIYTRKRPKQLVTSITLSETSLTLQPDEVRTLTATVFPADADNKELIWESSDSNVAEVNGRGRVIANGVGTCIIACHATDESGVKAECQVTVTTETHELTPVEQRFILYADQTVDSLRFYTFDSWTVTPQVDWISIDGASHMDINYDYSKRYLCRVFLNVLPNTTGVTRSGTVLVQSYNYSYSVPFVQLGMLDISHPNYTAESSFDEYGIIPKVVRFELVDSAHWTNDSICFKVENNWDLTFVSEAPEWLTLDKTTGLKGKCRVNLTLVPNVDIENGREAKLRLTSGEVSNEIVIRQLPSKK